MKSFIFGLAIAAATAGVLYAQQRSSMASPAGPNGTAIGSSSTGQAADDVLNYSAGKDHRITLPNDVSLDMVWIPSGTFLMGSPLSESSSQKWEHPQTMVTISKGFWLGKTPVTQGQYQALMGNNPSHFTKAGTDAPVDQVSWDNAMAFCAKLTERERAAGHLPAGFAYTLPTEAQWEYACRAGSTGPIYADDLFPIAWYGDRGGSTHPVGQKEPNAFGLYDMLGNVWEWCSDWFGDYPGGSVTDPIGPDTGHYRVIRGGSWWSGAVDCRSASRFWESHGYPYNELLGFRLAVSSVR